MTILDYDRLRVLLERFPEPEPFVPEMCSIPSGARANDSLWEYQDSLGLKTMRRIAFDRERRYAMVFYEDRRELRELFEYLLSYQARRRRVLDVYRQKLVHPFGDVDHFVLAYRHCRILNSWLGIERPVGVHRWKVPDHVVWRGYPVLLDMPDYASFMSAVEEWSKKKDEDERTFDPEFLADVAELGSTRFVIESERDFYLESDYSGRCIEWLTKWTMLKLRWT